jgi:chaperonin GroEL
VNNPDKLADMKKIGVVDPVAVTRQAIENAVSIAGTGMTMGALIVDIPGGEPLGGAAGMGGMMGM